MKKFLIIFLQPGFAVLIATLVLPIVNLMDRANCEPCQFEEVDIK